MATRSRPTIIDVARIAGVSQTTVSYVLSGSKQRAERISDTTTARILEAVNEIGYEPNQSARTLRLRRTNRVVFLGSRLNSLYSQVVASSIESALERHELTLSVQTGSNSDHIQRAISMLQQGHADGLIVETEDEYIPILRNAAASGHAIVAIGPSKAESTFDVMTNDDASAVRGAMRHLVDGDYHHFAILSSVSDVLHEHRVAVACGHLKSLGVDDANIAVHHCPHDRIAAYHFAMDSLPHLPRPLAVYAGADVSAIGTLWACLRLGLRVPDDVAIIGHGNSTETRITVPPLTSLGPVGRDFTKAADLMASRLKDRSLPGRHIAIPCELSIRASSH